MLYIFATISGPAGQSSSKFMLDSGASHSIISPEMAGMAGLEPSSTQWFTTASGSVQFPVAMAIITVNGESVSLPVIIAQDSPTVLGIDAIEALGLLRERY